MIRYYAAIGEWQAFAYLEVRVQQRSAVHSPGITVTHEQLHHDAARIIFRPGHDLPYWAEPLTVLIQALRDRVVVAGERPFQIVEETLQQMIIRCLCQRLDCRDAIDGSAGSQKCNGIVQCSHAFPCRVRKLPDG